MLLKWKLNYEDTQNKSKHGLMQVSLVGSKYSLVGAMKIQFSQTKPTVVFQATYNCWIV